MATDPDNALLQARIDLGESLAILRIAPLAGPLPEFEPGQFTNVGVRSRGWTDAPLCKRAFSIASSARTRDHMEFYVRRVAQGELTPLLFELHPGDRLWMDSRIHGRFTLTGVPPDSNILMIATGTGLAPFVSMLRTYHGRQRWRRCVLLESASSASDLGYESELRRISRVDPTIAYHPTLTREPESSAWRGMRGRVQNWLEPTTFLRLAGDPLDPPLWKVFLCGNPEMIVSVTSLLSDLGFRRHRKSDPGQIRTERYW